LSWTHYYYLIDINENEKRAFYENKVIFNSWSVRELRWQIRNRLYENTPKKDQHLEEAVIKSFVDKLHSVIWVRLAACYIVLVGVYFIQEYQERFPDESEEGGWSATE
jgi:hypothetical protein